jgi:hypothetical protein
LFSSKLCITKLPQNFANKTTTTPEADIRSIGCSKKNTRDSKQDNSQTEKTFQELFFPTKKRRKK